MNLADAIEIFDIYAGGAGSGCAGPNCGKKGGGGKQRMSVSLFNNNIAQGGNHDKVYHVQIEKHPSGGHVVNFQFGRRGAALQKGTKTPKPVDFGTASRIFNKLVEKKKNERGYSEM